MRKVILTMNEYEKFQIIKKHVATNSNKRTACLKLGCQLRHLNRLVAGYKDSGKAFFVHGNRGRKPTTALPENTRQMVPDLYRTKYYDVNLTHYCELFEEHEKTKVSISTISSILRKEYILSPLANRI